MYHTSRFRILFLTFISTTCLAYDNIHFYRATPFLYEPRLERDYLTTAEILFSTGSTREGRDKDRETVPLYDTWGLSNMVELGVGVPGKDLSNPYDLMLKNLSLIPSRCTDTPVCDCAHGAEFGTYSVSGKFGIDEIMIHFAQNFKRGFFFEVYAPVRKFTVKDTCFCDNSPISGPCPNTNTPAWKTFKNNFDCILARYDLKRDCISETGFGDVSLMGGWTNSFQDTEVLDFVDTTLRIGVLVPSGKCADINQVFSLPFGYDGHIGAIFAGEFAVGVFDWLTIGAHCDTIVFGNKTKCVRMQTAPFQRGIIKLAKGEADVSKGAVWNVAAYIKADHFMRGLSVLFGYSFANKNADHIDPCDTNLFPSAFANNEFRIKGFEMHTLNFIIEYDFAKEGHQFGPRVGAFYNLPVAGKQYFNTDTAGGYAGLEIRWDM